METKFGVQTLHSKCYLRIKPRNFWSSKSNETALVKFIGFFWDVSIPLCASQCYRPFFLKIKLTSVSRGLRGVFLSTIRNFAYREVKIIVSYGCNGGTPMERFVRHHTTTYPLE